MSKILVKNIQKLYQTDTSTSRTRVNGLEMDQVPFIENAYLAIENDSIVDFGSMTDLQGISDWNDLTIADANGGIVIPTFCDSHTHLVFAESREGEFVDRIKGLTYEEIALKGGGILNSAKKLNQATEDELFESALKRLDEVMHQGTGAIEIKSGYGLTVDAELKMLRVIKRLKAARNLPIKATFLGAHAFPAEYKENRDAYVNIIINEMIPVVASENLAEYIDIFIERNYFTVEQAERILTAGTEHGLKPKLHVNQFSIQGGIELATRFNAVSVDHLEELGEEDITALKNSTTIATGLPSCSFFLSLPYTPVNRLMEANIPVALASDYNPGSTPNGNMKLVFSMGCIKQRMTPFQALNAVTINGAAAMEMGDSVGTIAMGKKASFIISTPMKNIDFMPYAFGTDTIDSVVVNGEIIRKGKSFD